MVSKKKKRELESLRCVWNLGVDPGLGTTAMVLTKHDVPIAGVAVHGRTANTHALASRCHDIAQFCAQHAERWMIQHEIDLLFIRLELPFLRGESMRNVKTLMAQCELQGALVEAFHQLADESARVFLSRVHNTTAKAMFTGDGQASKTKIIARSVWAKRPDVEVREHLADAQAIAGVYGEFHELENDNPLIPTYVDSMLGKGAHWRGKWK